jgi:L-asparaginase
MQSTAPLVEKIVVILGTGGTIAGTSAHAADNVGYRAAQLSVDDLLHAMPTLAGVRLQTEQVAQIDSKDMGPAVWQLLAQRVAAHLARVDVAGIVITHGTDTLEETAYFLHRVLAPNKPVVLTAAMRPATSLQADGPQNLADAVTVARHPGACGVLAVMAGHVFAADGLRKADSYALDAFVGTELARVEEGVVRLLRPWPEPAASEPALGLQWIEAAPADWPRVAWITSHAGFDAALVDAVVAAGFHGLVVAATGNGTLHAALLDALQRAQQGGMGVRRVTRCANGRLVGDTARSVPASAAVGAAQARVSLLLELLGPRQRTP